MPHLWDPGLVAGTEAHHLLQGQMGHKAGEKDTERGRGEILYENPAGHCPAVWLGQVTVWSFCTGIYSLPNIHSPCC